MARQIVFMFSGQGSQYYHMGHELYANHGRFRAWMNHCNSIAQPLIGRSLIEILYGTGSRSDTFDRLLYSNAALLSVQFSTARVLIENEILPDRLLGYSLGEFVAAVISGSLSLDEGIGLAVETARLIEAALEPAIMLAVFDKPEILALAEDLAGQLWLTARNFTSNHVVCGAEAAMLELISRLRRNGIVHHRLPVNYPFHTPLLEPIAADYRALCQRLSLHPPRIPVVSSVTTTHVPWYDADFLWTVVREPIEFATTVTRLATDDNVTLIDVGPSGSLATFVKYLGVPATSLETMNPFGRDMASLQHLLAETQPKLA